MTSQKFNFHIENIDEPEDDTVRALIPLNNLFQNLSNPNEPFYLRDLPSPLQILDVCHLFTNLRDQLSRVRTQFLFPKVFPFLEKYLEGEDIKNCRLVSSAWKNGIDIELQKLPIWTPTFGKHLGKEKGHKYHRLITNFQTPEQAMEFMVTFSSGELFPANPFPGRALMLTNGGQHNLVKACGSVLSTFGIHCWHLIYSLHVNEITNMRRIIRVLQETPFLKSLTLVAFGDPYAQEPFRGGRKVILIPKLDTLVSLRLISYDHAWEATPASSIFQLWDALLQQYGKQLESFECTGDVFYTNYLKYPGFEALFMKLRQLKMFHVDAVQLCQKIRQIYSPLEKVSLEFRHPLRLSFVALARVFQRFSSTLVELHLGFEHHHLTVEQATGMKKEIGAFPKLIHLGIPYTYLDNPLIVKILQKFSALRELTLYWHLFQKMAAPSGEEILIAISSTEIWLKLPKLRKISIIIRNWEGTMKQHTFWKPQGPIRTQPRRSRLSLMENGPVYFFGLGVTLLFIGFFLFAVKKLVAQFRQSCLETCVMERNFTQMNNCQ